MKELGVRLTPYLILNLLFDKNAWQTVCIIPNQKIMPMDLSKELGYAPSSITRQISDLKKNELLFQTSKDGLTLSSYTKAVFENKSSFNEKNIIPIYYELCIKPYINTPEKMAVVATLWKYQKAGYNLNRNRIVTELDMIVSKSTIYQLIKSYLSIGLISQSITGRFRFKDDLSDILAQMK